MHIEFTRSGGFAGMRLGTSVDTDQLPAEQASTLDRLISEAGFFDLPEKITPTKPAPDRFEYNVTVDSGEKTHSIVVNEKGAPDSLRPLLNYLTTLAMVSRKG
jgi:hypothetical protein